MRELSKVEKSILEGKVEKFLNEEVFNWSIINEDNIEEKIIEEIINILNERINYY